jgi:uncharacterized membrane protein YhiD involved in acid resistance
VILSCSAACLFTLISAYGSGGPADPSRLAAQIVTGIGFLGGGAIVRHGLTVKGLTTAASIWATASIGVAVGAGSYVLAAGGAVLVIGTLFALRAVRNLLQRWSVSREEFVLSTGPGFDVKLIAEVAGESGWACAAWSVRRPRMAAGSCWWPRAPHRRPGCLGVYEVEWEH